MSEHFVMLLKCLLNTGFLMIIFPTACVCQFDELSVHSLQSERKGVD